MEVNQQVFMDYNLIDYLSFLKITKIIIFFIQNKRGILTFHKLPDLQQTHSFQLKAQYVSDFDLDIQTYKFILLDYNQNYLLQGRLDIQLQKVEIYSDFQTCGNPINFIKALNQNVIVIICKDMTIDFYEYQIGQLIKRLKLSNNLKYFSYLINLNKLFGITENEFQHIMIDLSSIQNIPERLKMRNEFSFTHSLTIQNDIILKGLNYIYTFNKESLKLNQIFNLNEKIQSIQIIDESNLIIISNNGLFLWDLQLNQIIKIIEFQIIKIKIILFGQFKRIIVLQQHNKIIEYSLIIKNNLSFSLEESQSLIYHEQIKEIKVIQNQNLLLLLTENGHLVIYENNFNSELLNEQICQNEIFKIKIITQQPNDFTDNTIIFFAYYKRKYLQMIKLTKYTENEATKLRVLYQKTLEYQQSISYIKQYSDLILVTLKDANIIYCYKIIQNSQEYIDIIINQIELPIRRNYISMSYNNEFNSLLVYTDYTFCIFDLKNQIPLYIQRIDDKSFTYNSIVDISLINPSQIFISSKNYFAIANMTEQISQFSKYLIIYDYMSLRNQIQNVYQIEDGSFKIFQIEQKEVNDEQNQIQDEKIISQQQINIIGYSQQKQKFLFHQLSLVHDLKQSIVMNDPSTFEIINAIQTAKQFIDHLHLSSIKIVFNISQEYLENNNIDLQRQVNINNMNITFSGHITLNKIRLHENFQVVIFEDAMINTCQDTQIRGSNSDDQRIYFKNSIFIGCADRGDSITIRDVHSIYFYQCQFKLEGQAFNFKFEIVNFFLVDVDQLTFDKQITDVMISFVLSIGSKFNLLNSTINNNNLNIQNKYFFYNQGLIQLNTVNMVTITNLNITQNLINEPDQQFYIISLNNAAFISINQILFIDNQQLNLIYTLNCNMITISSLRVENNIVNTESNDINQLIKFDNSYSISFYDCIFDFNQLSNLYIAFISRGGFLSLINCQITSNKSNSIFYIYNGSVTAKKLKAQNNISNNSGTVLFINSNNQDSFQVISKIEDSIFSYNTAKYNGGAIFIINCPIQIQNSIFKNNNALIGGAIRYLEQQSKIFKDIIKKVGSKIYIDEFQNIFENNEASYFGKNIGSYPSIAAISSKHTIQDLKIYDQLSGDYLNNVVVYILDEEKNLLNFTYLETFKKIKGFNISNLYLKDQNEYQIAISSKNSSQIEFQGGRTFVFNQNNTFSIQNLKIYGNLETYNGYISLNFPFLATFENDEFQYGKQFDIFISFRKCQKGEIYNKLAFITFECQVCPENKYSLVIPNENDIQVCKKCNDIQGVLSCSSDKLTIQPGYWRENEDTDSVFNCFNQPQNCNGDQTKNYCIEGLVGPLCQQCDLYGKVWGKRYGQIDTYSCQVCSNNNIILLKQFVIVIIIMMHLTFSIKNVINKAVIKIKCNALSKLNWIQVGTSSQINDISIYIKFLMNFIQVIEVIPINEQIYLSKVINNFISIFGSPSKSLSSSFDCLLSQYQFIPIEYLRVIWASVSPFIILIIIFFIYAYYLSLFPKQTFNSNYIYITLSFSLLYFQSGVISQIILVLSCEQINNVNYIKSFLSKQCYTTEHITYLTTIVIPLLIFWIILFPSIILFRITKNKNNLNNPSKLLKYSIYYEEYKPKYFYWEFIVMFYRITLIIVGSIFTQLNQIIWKFGLSIVIINLYNVACLKLSPYIQTKFNKLNFNLTQILNLIFIFWLLHKISYQMNNLMIFAYLYYALLAFVYIFYAQKILSQMLTQSSAIQNIYNKIFRKKKQKNTSVVNRFILWRRLSQI